jgi:peptidyl-Lys metalloendopeptidase
MHAFRRTFPAALAVALLTVGCRSDQPSLTEATAAASVSAAGASAVGPLDVQLSLPRQAMHGNGKVMVLVAVTNTSAEVVAVPEWTLPADDMDEALFTVRLNGQPVAYVGPHVKRGALQASDLVTINPGVTKRYAVDLASVYDLSRDGQYSVEYESGNAHGVPSVAMHSSAEKLSLTGRSAKASVATASTASLANLASLAAVLSYSGCTAAQQTQLVAAVQQAATYAAGAKSYLATYNSGSARYAKWFGPVNNTNWGTVASHFTSISDAFNTKPITLDCSCKKQYYAYVYPNKPYQIYLCRAFWAAPLTGTDSRAGTLIHEMSHFTVVASTDDWAYGQSAAASLAISNPLRAIDNADSHEYFAENTPILN